MSQTDTFRLLILTETQNEAERLISVFRNAGNATRAHRITSIEDFQEHLADMSWDLLLADGKHEELSIEAALTRINEAGLDIPCVVLLDSIDSDNRAQYFSLGCQDVVAHDDDQHLIHVARREIRNARSRNTQQRLSEELSEVSQRAEQLLGESQDAIAYVADGMHIVANDMYADFFGYTPDDMQCMPIIDLVSTNDQERFKTFLKHLANEDGAGTSFTFTGVKEDGSEISVTLSSSASSYDGESCTQLLVQSQANGSAESVGNTDPYTNLLNRHGFEQSLENIALQVSKGICTADLLCFGLDNIAYMIENNGLRGIDSLMKAMASVITAESAEGDVIGRLGDHTLAVILLSRSPEQAEEFAQHCVKLIEDSICEIDGQTVQYSASASVVGIKQELGTDELLDQTYIALRNIHLRGDKSSVERCDAVAKPTTDTGAVASLEEAIDHDRFRLLFQPIISLRGDSREHYEVFLRMLDANDKEIPPSEFLQDATDTKLDRWVILEATKQLSLHRAEGHDTCLIINLTANALLDEGLVAWVGVAIKAANLPPDCIVFQFQETDINKHLNAAKATNDALAKLNIPVSIGGYGKSLDPAKTLRNVNVTFVKIDGSFTLDLQENRGDPQLLKALVNTINASNMASIVPCVENASVLATLWQVGVNYIQGHYLQPPLPAMNYEFTEIT